MAILSAQSITEACAVAGLVTPCCVRTEVEVPDRPGQTLRLTYGLSSCGYDIRLDAGVTISPRQFVLASSLEHFAMPEDLMGVVHDKSTWARRGLAVQNTVIEPGWHGYLTLELTNHGAEQIIIGDGWPIAQVVFHELDRATNQPYSGKYQFQERGPQGAR